MHRSTLAAIVALALLSQSAPLAAQHAARVLEDADTFRASRATFVANARVAVDDEVRIVRVRRSPSGFEIIEGGGVGWSVDRAELPFELRVAAALLGSSAATDAVASLGARLDAANVGFELYEALDGRWLVQRIGGPQATLLVEPGISRPRELRIEAGRTVFLARVTEYAAVGGGWIPTQVEVVVNGRVSATLALLDVATSVTDLSPLSVATTPTVRPRVRFPRVPL